MTGNLSVAIMKKTDAAKKGFLEVQDIVSLASEDPVFYQMLTDLHNFAPDFMDKHRQVILNGGGAAPKSKAGGSATMANMVGSKLRQSINKDLASM